MYSTSGANIHHDVRTFSVMKNKNLNSSRTEQDSSMK